MKRTGHTPEQIITKLREADAMLGAGRTIAQVVQHLGVSEPTLHRWRNQYGGMKAGDARRLKELEHENSRLKKIVADHAGAIHGSTPMSNRSAGGCVMSCSTPSCSMTCGMRRRWPIAGAATPTIAGRIVHWDT